MTESILIISAFFSSALSAIIGMGGGLLLISIMSAFFPPAVLIPLHGIIQFGSNVSRSIAYAAYINWKMSIPFAFGSVVGATIGSQLLITIPLKPYYLTLGTMIILLTWMPKTSVPNFKGKFFFLGSGASFLSLFVGATGPFLAPFFLRESLDKHSLIATKALCQVTVHTTKLIVFFSVGFVLGPYLYLILGMLLAGFVGTYCGKFLLGKVDEKIFRIAFKIAITLLAVRLLWKGI